MTIYRIRLEEANIVDTRRKEVEHSGLVVKKGIVTEKDGPRREYEVSDFADPNAVGYIFFGNIENKEKFDEKLRSGRYAFLARKACPFCNAQT